MKRGTKPHRVKSATKKGSKKRISFKNRIKTGNYAKNPTLSNAGTSSKALILDKFNRAPMAFRTKQTFQYNTYFTMTCPQYQSSATSFWSLMSPYDPDLSNVGSNLTVPYWLDMINASTVNMMYKYYRVNYVEVQVKCINNVANTFPMIVYSANSLGNNSYGSS